MKRTTPIQPANIDVGSDPGLTTFSPKTLQPVILPTGTTTTGTASTTETVSVQIVKNIYTINPPGGANGEVQFNFGGSYTGDGGLTYVPSTDTLTTGTLNVTQLNPTRINLSSISNLTISGGSYNNVLKTDGAGTLSWESAFPSDAGNSGKFLKSNGINQVWANVSYANLVDVPGNIATTDYVGNAIATLVDSSPNVLNTLNELANALGNDASFSTSITNSLANKASVISVTNLSNTVANISWANLSGAPNIDNYATTANLSTLSNTVANITWANLSGKPTIPTDVANLTDLTSLLGGGGIALTDISVGAPNSANGSGNISYANSTGVFTYTPPVIPDVSGFALTSAIPTDIANLADATNLLGAGGIALTDLSVTTSNTANGSGDLSYANSTGVFTYTPPNLSSYLTAITNIFDQDLNTANNTQFNSVTTGNIFNNGNIEINTPYGTTADIDIYTDWAGNGSSGGIDLWLKHGDGLYVKTHDGDHVWSFDDNGILNLPVGGDIRDSTGNSVLGGGGGANTGNITFSDTTMASTNGNVKIGFSPSASPAVEFTFVTTGNLVLPKGTILSETANSTTITPPNALAGQSLVVRLTGAQGITSDHPGGFTDGDTITLTIVPDYSLTPVTGTVDYTFTDCTQQQLGRALTGTLTFTNEPSKQITWTIPVSSTMTTFTITLSNAVGFSIGGLISPLTLTRSGSSEDHHIHLIAGDPSITDMYLGDDDQYVKIEKNGGNVLIGTNENNNQWTFGTDGTLTLPDGSGVAGGFIYGAPGEGAGISNGGTGYQQFFVQGDGAYVQTSVDNSGTVFNTWQFGLDGILTVPGDIVAEEDNDLNFEVYNATTGGGTGLSFVNYDSNVGQKTTQFIIGSSNAELTTNFNHPTGSKNTWVFEQDGNLTLPTNSSNINYANGTSILSGLGGGGIALTDLSIGTDGTPTGGGNVSYNNTTGVFTYTPPVIPDVSGFITSSTPTLDNISAGDMDVMIYDGNFKYTSKVTIDASRGHLKTAGDLSVSGNTIIQGNLSVTGTQTINNTTTLTVNDNKITLNSGQSGTPSLNASVLIDRGSSSDVDLRWNETTDKWEQTRDGSTYVNIPINTTELSEGTNLYYTDARANTAFDNKLATKSTDNLTEGSTNIYFTTARSNTAFDNRLAVKSTTNLTEGTNLYYTDTRANTAFDNRLATKSTSNLTEGTNLYYTNARANSAMAAFTGNLTAGNASLGNLVTANYFAGTLTTAAQPNITSTGTLTSLNVTGTITGGNLTSNAEIAGYGALTLGNIANATATKTRIVTAGSISYIQTGNGTAGSTGNIVFSPTLDATARVTIDTSSGNLNATGNITGANLIAGSSGQGNVYAGNVIVNGQTVTLTGAVNPDYIQVEKSADQASVAKNADINFNVTTATNGGIAFASNIFTLLAGKTYLLDATLCTNNFSSSSAFIWYSWVDATTNAQLDTSNGSSLSAGSSGVVVPKTWTANDDYSSSARLIYTPATNQTVKLRATDGSGTCNVLQIGTKATIVQINPTVSLSAVSTINASGNVSVGGNLAVTGNIAGTAVKITAPTFQAVTPSWGLSDVASAAWFLLGTWNTAQAGNCLYMRLLGHCGYNGVATQNQVTELMFVTSNDSSYIAGSSGNYYAAGSASVNSRLGTGATYQAPNKFRIIQVSKTQYQIYAYFGSAYMRNSNYSIQITPGDTWTDGGGNGGVTAPTGNYVEITPSSF